MKKICIVCFFFLLINNQKSLAQNVGIGTNTPSEKLTVNGNVLADSFKYSIPKVFYYSVNEAAFKARNTAETVITAVGNGGAYITNGTNYGLVAPVNLPQGANIITITVHFYDASMAQDLNANLINEFSSGYNFLASVSSTGSVGLNIQTYTLPAPQTINNSFSSYEILVVPSTDSWNTSDIAIRSVIIQYTMNETN